jgi:hypothetical protein
MPARKTTKTNKATAPSQSRKRIRASASATKISVPIYQIKVMLKDFKPSIWRRIQVRSDATLGELHAIIQMVMGWTNSHLHHFIVGKRPNILFIGPRDPYEGDVLSDGDDEADEDKIMIYEVLRAANSKIVYEYDFGDSWEHEVVLEKIGEAEEGVHYPRCLAGENACPPEDVGGVWGYAHFLKAIVDPRHEEHESSLEWVGGDFDPHEFNLDAVNKLLKVRKNYEWYGHGIF